VMFPLKEKGKEVRENSKMLLKNHQSWKSTGNIGDNTNLVVHLRGKKSVIVQGEPGLMPNGDGHQTREKNGSAGSKKRVGMRNGGQWLRSTRRPSGAVKKLEKGSQMNP